MDDTMDKNSSSPDSYSLFSAENSPKQAFAGSLLMDQTDEDGYLNSTYVDPSNFYTTNFSEASISDRIVAVPAEMLSGSGITAEEIKAVFPEVPDSPTSSYVQASRVKVSQSGDRNTNPFDDAQTSSDCSLMSQEMEPNAHVLSEEQQQQMELKDTSHNEKTEVGHTQHTALKVSEDSEKAILNRGLIDTAAPFESVKEAVTKFGGVIDWKAHTAEKRQYIEVELENIEECIPKFKKQSEDEEILKRQVLEELDSTKILVEELKLSLEKAEIEAVQAKQDTELAELRVKEMEQGIANNVSVAAKAQLEIAKARHQNAVAELISVRQELESLEKDYVFLVHDRDIAIRKSQESVSELKEIEKNVEDLTLELITTKSLLESAHSAHLEAEEQKIGSVLAWEQDKVKWEKELKLAEEELKHHKHLPSAADLESKLEAAFTLLANIKVELAIQMEATMNQMNTKSIDFTNTEEGEASSELAMTRKDLKKVMSNIDKVKNELNRLRDIENSLKSELEMKQTSMTTLRQKETLTNVSISSLQAEINKTTTELELVMTKEKEAEEKKDDLPKTLQLVAEEADQAKSLVLLAHEELKRAKKEAEQLKAGLSTMETRLDAAIKEIKAAKMAEKLAISTLNGLKESGSAINEPEYSPRRVTLPVDEYYALIKNAKEADELAKSKVMSAYEQIKVIKDSELRSLQKLKKANKEMEERRKAFESAIEKADEAEESKLAMEDELQQWISEHDEELSKESDFDEFETDEGSSNENISDTVAKPVIYRNAPSLMISKHMKSKGGHSDSKFRKRSFLPRILMFLAKKKAQSYK